MCQANKLISVPEMGICLGIPVESLVPSIHPQFNRWNSLPRVKKDQTMLSRAKNKLLGYEMTEGATFGGRSLVISFLRVFGEINKTAYIIKNNIFYLK